MRFLYRHLFKRLIDVLVASTGLLVSLPFLMVVACIIQLDTPGPIFFIQSRLGRNGRIFKAIKFRTMHHRRRIPTREVFGRDVEVTRFGYWLRRFKIDEIPQLWNVLWGEMSLIGPRPALVSQIKEYDELALQRLKVRPGLTGLAQVRGNIHLSWPERWQYDADYVARFSIALDCWIALRTVLVILRGEEYFLKKPEPILEQKKVA